MTDPAPLTLQLRQLPPASARRLLADHLREEIIRFLAIDEHAYDPRAGFADLGFDSLRAVDFKDLLEQQLEAPLRSTLLFDYATPHDLTEYLAGDVLGIPSAEAKPAAPEPTRKIEKPAEDLESLDAETLRSLLRERTGELAALRARTEEPIAIVGMACRFPGAARNLEDYWALQLRGEDAVSEVPPERWSIDRFYSSDRGQVGKMATRRAGFLEDPVDRFDARHFNISPREAQQLDPQQRILLETAWHTIEDAGIPAEALNGSQVGVFIGLRESEYFDSQSGRIPEAAGAYYGTGNALSTAAGRLSFFFGLKGPCIALDTACSSSLVALHIAVQSIRRGECEAALVGGVNLILDPLSMVGLSQAQMLSPDGRCKTFDASADGYVRSEGCGLVLLKRLSRAQADGDRIYAVVRGTAINQDGAGSGLTVPNGPSQERVLRSALANGGLEPFDVDFIEAHGTGTSLGDPIEVGALDAVFGPGRDRPLLVASVKTNIGHLETGAGIAGLIRTALSIHHSTIPAHLHLSTPNPHIDWEHTVIQVPQETRPWPERPGPRVAGVSSFGFSGTNAHVVISQAPLREDAPSEVRTRTDLLPLSAATPAALESLVSSVQTWCRGLPEDTPLESITAPAALGRTALRHRRVLVAKDRDELEQQLAAAVARPDQGLVFEATSEGPRVAWLFTGQGSQWPGMGKDLYAAEPVFKETIDRCTDGLRDELEQPLRDILFGDACDLVHQTRYTQPSLFALEIALARLWQSLGLMPRWVLGHSVGEYAAACLAGVFSLEDGLRLISARGRLMTELTTPGDMIAVLAAREKIEPIVAPFEDRVQIAVENGPTSFVLSGDRLALETIRAELVRQGLEHQPLTVSHAFHSPLMDPMLAEFEKVARSVTYSRPQVPFVSNLEPGLCDEALATPEYWVRHVREPVRFLAGMRALDALGADVYLEIGPVATLLGMARRFLARRELAWLPSLRAQQPANQTIARSLGELWIRGAEVDWSRWHGGPKRRGSLRLPPYPFQRERYWFDRSAAVSTSTAERPTDHPLLGRELSTVLSRRGDRLFVSEWSELAPRFLKDHRVFDRAIAPAAAYLETLRAAAELAGEPAVLEDILIQAPLPLGASETSMQIAVTRGGDGETALELASRVTGEGEDSSAPTWRTHVVARAGSAEEPIDTPDTLEELAQRCDRKLDIEDIYAAHARLGLDYGPAFRVIDSCWSGEAEALARLRLPVDIAPDGFGLHPALLDGCFQVIGALATDSRQTMLPTGAEGFRLRARAGRELWCHVARRPDLPGSRGFRVDVTLLDARGEPLGEVRGLHLVPASRAALLGVEEKIDDLLYEVTWSPQALPATQDHERVAWIVAASGDPLAGALARELPGTIVSRGELKSSAGPAPAHVVWLEGASDLAPQGSKRALALTSQALEVVQALPSEAAPRLWLITRNGQAATDNAPTLDPAGTAISGFAATARLEHPELSVTVVDLGVSHDEDAKVLADEIRAATRETLVAWRGGERLVARLSRSRDARSGSRLPLPSDAHSFKLQVAEYGSLDRLEIAPCERRSPGAGEVEIAVRAAGLNFKDVLHALGMLKQFAEAEGIQHAVDQPLGFECAGEVVALGAGVTGFSVGDRIVASGAGCLASHLTLPATGIAQQPSTLEPVDAAAIQTVFLTAVYALERLAKIRKGDRVLIHAAAGGVGQAAIQIARRAGAEIYATASEGKWEHLKSQGIEHVYNSRTLDFADQVLADTSGEGVDIVLNSLAGDFIGASVGVLASDGRFVEIGKIDIWDDARMDAMRPDVDYFSFDLSDTFRDDPSLLSELLQEISSLFEAGELQPLARQVFDLRDARQAFSHLAQAKNIGKVVLTIPDPSESEESGQGREVQGDRRYIVTGGLGALGRVVARALVDEGVRHLTLVSRSATAEAAEDLLSELAAEGANVQVAAVDLSDRAAVESFLDEQRAQGPALGGVVHAAGVLDDGMMLQQTPERLQTVLGPKAGGAQWLHELTRDDDLTHFVLFSSMVSLLGNAGQSGYAAANGFLDGLAEQRAAEKLPAQSIGWGPWAEAGMAARLDERSRARLSEIGLRALDPDVGATIFKRLLRDPTPYAAVIPIDWKKFLARIPGAKAPAFLETFARAEASGPKKRSAILEELITSPAGDRPAAMQRFLDQQLSEVLGFSSSGQIEARQSFSDLGVDSLLAVDLKSRIESSFDVSLPATLLFDQPNLEALGTFLLGQLEDRFGAVEETEIEEVAATDEGDDLHTLDEDELAQRLAEQLEAMQDGDGGSRS